MKTNELKRGDRVQLRNGWFATIADNAKGNTRIAKVEGFVTDTGSIYAHNIMRLVRDQPGTSESTVIEHTPAQDKLRANIMRMGL